MNFINFESARDKEKTRNELRIAREELLKKAKENAEKRIERETERKLRGEENWILPSIDKKLKNSQSKKLKKDIKKSHKKSKTKDKKNSSDNERSIKKSKKRCYSTEKSSSSSTEEEWIEKPNTKMEPSAVRDDWMTGGFMLQTYSKGNENKKDKEKAHIDAYDPKKSARELNPYWKDGGSGLPAFQKPTEDVCKKQNYFHDRKYGSGNWKKTSTNTPYKTKDSVEVENKVSNYSNKNNSNLDIQYKRKDLSSSSSSENEPELSKVRKKSTSSFMTDQQMNELGAKIVKAEILGNDELAKSLKDKLESARNIRNQIKHDRKQDFVESSTLKSDMVKKSKHEHILLTRTDNKGITRPLLQRDIKPIDPWGGRKCKSKKVETHAAGERVRYFADDDRYDIKQMFEREKYTTGADADLQFAEIAGKHKNLKDDLEDIFEDKARKNVSEYDDAKKEQQRAIEEHKKLTKTLDDCDKCFDSVKMEKQLMVSMGNTVYLSLPWHEGLQLGHCLIIPIQHVSCSTQLDENTWEEINDYRKSLTRMFAAKKKDIIFFETARYLHRRQHMTIHCIASSNFEMAPFYFKKAIQESEYEWSTNKQLISLKDRDLRKAIPKGLPYFWVHFGMESGFAHVIEDEERFPSNFAQEIIGGILQLDPKTWRKPRKEFNSIQKVKQIADWWKPYDFTT